MNNPLIGAIRAMAEKQPQAIAMRSLAGELDYAGLVEEIERVGSLLHDAGAGTIALALDNSPAWAVLDLAALDAGHTVVPLPFFFSAEQVGHAIRDAHVDCVVTDQPEYYAKLLAEAGIAIHGWLAVSVCGQQLTELICGRQAATARRRHSLDKRPLSSGAAKITYTSGTTGQPKGVCLSADALYRVSASLLEASGGQAADRHLSVLPLATLLENIGGVYVPLMAGATCQLLPLAEVGLSGAARLDVRAMVDALSGCAASTTILTPELLQGLVAAIEAGYPAPAQLRFIAVGGAPVAERLLQRAQALGLPVFEGYGLSECCSVVALNTPQEYRAGSVGKPLPHVRLQFAEDGEILAAGANLLGYTGAEGARQAAEYWPTGDLGHLDEAGFLHITGRKKNIFITSFGRNVAPEWVERELTLHPAIAQAAVFGEARPWNVAVIVARGSSAEVDQAIAEANRVLPDYAQIRCWIPAAAPFTPRGGQLTPNGRLRRAAVWNAYQAAIDQLYEETIDAVL